MRSAPRWLQALIINACAHRPEIDGKRNGTILAVAHGTFATGRLLQNDPYFITGTQLSLCYDLDIIDIILRFRLWNYCIFSWVSFIIWNETDKVKSKCSKNNSSVMKYINSNNSQLHGIPWEPRQLVKWSIDFREVQLNFSWPQGKCHEIPCISK